MSAGDESAAASASGFGSGRTLMDPHRLRPGVSGVSSARSSRSPRLRSLAFVTVRRGLVAGRLYLAFGTGIVLVLSLVLLRSKAGVFAVTFPLEVPLFASLGALGGLMLFSSDRSKGVLEYSIAYGVPPGRLFANVLVATVVLASVVLGAALAVGLGAYLATGGPITSDLENALLLYTVPMTYAGSLFSAVAGMVWSSLSTPRAGMNSPTGIAPILSVAPAILVLYLAEAAPRSDYYYITGGASAAIVALALILLAASSRWMDRERYLSPM
jgi:hypothetical protein